MAFKRREFLLFLGASVGSVAWNSRALGNEPFAQLPVSASQGSGYLNFQPILGPMPLATDVTVDNVASNPAQRVRGSRTEQRTTYAIVDDLVLPEGFTYDLIAVWGDKVGDSRCGYNNDYLSYLETAPNQGLLTINFEYLSDATWMATYPLVIGKDLPFAEVKAALAEREGSIDAFALADDNLLKKQIQAISQEGLIDLGLGVISLRRQGDGKWERTYSKMDRRVTGISGWEDGRYLKSTGPAVAVFEKNSKLGYEDGLRDRIIGSFSNCSGGTTPWGTVMSAEENFYQQVPEPVQADGSALDPSQTPFQLNEEKIRGLGNVFGLAGNKYGWMVEIDPANPQDYSTKHTWLGRFRHEAVAIKAQAKQPLAVYSGCDRRGGHIYKFVSQGIVTNPQDKANSRLLEAGMLYGAKFNPDGTGTWIPLRPDTPVNPVLPSQVEGEDEQGLVVLPNPNRAVGGVVTIINDTDALTFKETFATLGELYTGNEQEKQGAILIDAHYAATAAGITCTARPEDVDIAPDGSLLITFTSGSPGDDGGPDKQVFQGPQGETPWEYGWIVRLSEVDNQPAAMSFNWSVFALGGEPAAGGAGFANPDNLEIDANGNVWMVTDISTSQINQAVPSRTQENGQPLSQTEIKGVFGNNSLWFMPTSGEDAGNAYLFAMGPMECETTGPFFTKDQKTLFLAIQHPGEANGIRQDNGVESRQFVMQTTDGQEFEQIRQVPIGSNWPSKQPNQPPLPGVVAIRKLDDGMIS